MMSASEEQKVFEALKPELVRNHLGRFAVVCGRSLLGVYDSVDEALLASSREFDAGTLPEGAALFISEIAEQAALRVTARPYPKGEARGRAVAAGEIRAS
jgi:hypothetical protein